MGTQIPLPVALNIRVEGYDGLLKDYRWSGDAVGNPGREGCWYQQAKRSDLKTC